MSPVARLPLQFLAAGAVSGLLCWLGGLIAPEHTLAIRIFPGLVFGLVLYAIGHHAGYAPPRRRAATATIVVVTSILSWRLAIDVGYMHGGPWPMLAAGALGGLVLALGLAWAWQWRRHVTLTVTAIALTGAFGAQCVQWMWNASPGMDERLQVSLLFVGWQALVMMVIALTGPPPGEV